MADHAYPTTTPNIVIKDPNRRQRVYDVLGIAGLILGAVIAADLAAPAFDLSAWTDPLSAAFVAIATPLGFYAARSNVPGA